jgi:anti-sigma factor RsiW
VKALTFSSLALAGLLVTTTAYVGDAEAARKRMSAKPAAAAQAKQPSRYGSSSQARPATPAQNAAPAASVAPARTGSAPATAGAPAAQAAAPQAAGSGFMGSMAGAVAGSVIGGAVANTLFADDAVAAEAPAADVAPEQVEAVAQ